MCEMAHLLAVPSPHTGMLMHEGENKLKTDFNCVAALSNFGNGYIILLELIDFFLKLIS